MSDNRSAKPAATTLDGPNAVRAAAGTHLGWSEWLTIDQNRIDQFAAATGDDQWIHVDPERAASGPFGATIAHGYLTMSLSNYFLPRVVEVRGFAMGINYGVNKVRFPAPVPVGSNVRAGVELTSVREIAGGLETEMTITIELDQSERPGCVIVAISRWIEATPGDAG